MLVLGHRGEPRLAPENTVASFALVRDDLDHGVDGAECDVQMTKDGELVVIHDEKVDRTTDGHGWVKDLTLQEIRKFDAGVRFPGPLHHEPIPTMQEVFEVFDRTRATLNVELKNSEIAYGDGGTLAGTGKQVLGECRLLFIQCPEHGGHPEAGCQGTDWAAVRTVADQGSRRGGSCS